MMAECINVECQRRIVGSGLCMQCRVGESEEQKERNREISKKNWQRHRRVVLERLGVNVDELDEE